MNGVQLTAKFIGVDSRGYNHGTSYDIYVQNNTVYRRTSQGRELSGVPYGSIEAFFTNWIVNGRWQH